MKKVNLYVVLLLGLLLSPSVQAKRIGYYFYFDPADKHQYEDENVRVYMENNGLYVYNKTDKIIFIDKGNCYAIQNGSYVRMWSNSSSTSGTSTNRGVAVDLGIINKNLSGITVGGGNGSYNQTTIYMERIQALPPKSLLKMHTWGSPFYLMEEKGYIKDNGNVFCSLTPRSRYIEPGTGNMIKLTKGFIRTFNLENSPLRYKALITYSLTEDMQDAKEVSTDENYLKAMVADSYKGYKDYRVENLPYCQPFMMDTENYTCWSRYKEGHRIEDIEGIVPLSCFSFVCMGVLLIMP